MTFSVRCHIADGTVEAYGVVVIHVGLNQTQHIDGVPIPVPVASHLNSDVARASAVPSNCSPRVFAETRRARRSLVDKVRPRVGIRV